MKYDRDIIQLNPQCSEYNSVTTYILKPGVCEFKNREFNNKFIINKFGHRENTNIADADYVILGDSLAMGWGVENDNSFPNILERKLKKKIYNMSISSFGTARELISLRNHEIKKNANIIISYNRNDFEENRTFTQNFGFLPIMPKKKYQEISTQHKAKSNYFFLKHTIYLTKLFFSKLVSKEKEKLGQASSMIEARTFLKTLAYFPDILANRNLIILNSQNKDYLKNNFLNSVAFLIKNQNPITFPLKITLIDPGKFLDNSNYYILDDHYNSSGHMKVAQVVFEEIKNLKPILKKTLSEKSKIDNKSKINNFTFNKSNITFFGYFDKFKNIKTVDIFFDKEFFTSVTINQKKIEIELPLIFFEKLDRMSIAYKYLDQEFRINLDTKTKSKIKKYFKPELHISFNKNQLILNDKLYKKIDLISNVEKLNVRNVVGWLVSKEHLNANIKVLTVLNNKPISFLNTMINRPDVSKALNIENKRNFGYYIPLPLNIKKSDLKNLRLYAILDNGYYDELKISVN